MNESIKINSFELENVKRVHHVMLEPKAEGLTVIGGKNAQGKTSILDAISWALGGDKYKPVKAENDQAPTPPKLKVELSNGLIVERKGKNGALYVTDPTGEKAGQRLLDSFVEKLAIDLPRFLDSNSKEKARTLLQIIGVEEELHQMEQEEEKLYQERLLLGRVKDQKKGTFEELGPYKENVPADPISAAELINQQQEILLQNAKNQEARNNVEYLQNRLKTSEQNLELMRQKQKDIMAQIEEAEKSVRLTQEQLIKATECSQALVDGDTTQLEENIRNIDRINQDIRFNQMKKTAETEYLDAEKEYKDLTLKIEQIRQDKLNLLNGADLPLPELSVDDNGLTYKGHAWEDMSSAEQLRVAVAIVRRLKPECGFVLLDKLEQFDIDTMNEFGAWLEKEGLQVIATRVSTGEECQIVIEDGYVKQDTPAGGWKPGAF